MHNNFCFHNDLIVIILSGSQYQVRGRKREKKGRKEGRKTETMEGGKEKIKENLDGCNYYFQNETINQFSCFSWQ